MTLPGILFFHSSRAQSFSEDHTYVTLQRGLLLYLRQNSVFTPCSTQNWHERWLDAWDRELVATLSLDLQFPRLLLNRFPFQDQDESSMSRPISEGVQVEPPPVFLSALTATFLSFPPMTRSTHCRSPIQTSPPQKKVPKSSQPAISI